MVSIIPLFISSGKFISKYNTTELYDSTYADVEDIESAILFIDKYYQKTAATTNFDTILYTSLASDFVKARFYHGLANYTVSDNWIAYLTGRYLWSHFSAIVNPNDLLKHDEGLCSQQTIVFLALLKQKGISFRSVGLGYPEGPGHFLAEVRYQGTWHLYDVTMEPQWEKISEKNMSMAYYQQYPDSLYLTYEQRMRPDVFNKIMEKVEYGVTNVLPAKNMRLFHQTTKVLIYVLPILFLVLVLISFFRKSKK